MFELDFPFFVPYSFWLYLFSEKVGHRSVFYSDFLSFCNMGKGLGEALCKTYGLRGDSPFFSRWGSGEAKCGKCVLARFWGKCGLKLLVTVILTQRV
jgi:hypothetical protein